MKAETKLHQVQFQILRYLLFHPGVRFSDLNRLGLTSDHFNFHIRALLDAGLVTKTSGGKYDLTIKGKEYGNRLDTEGDGVEKQAKIGVLIVAIKVNKFLIQQRLKQPYFGYYGFFGGKVKWGEVPLETAIRELREEAGLTAKKMTLVAIKHKMDYAPDGLLLEDKYFFVYRAEGVSGKFIGEFEGGKNLWLTREEIYKLPNLFDGVRESLESITNQNFAFIENKYRVSGF